MPLKNDAISEAYEKIGDWWGEDLPETSMDMMVRVVGISIGLGELFNDNREAEIDWLKQVRRCKDPWGSEIHNFMDDIKGGKPSDIIRVCEWVDVARNLR